jgi:hypothetical protein
MKKMLIILSMFVAYVATSCVQPYEQTDPLTLNNYDLILPKTSSKKGLNGENIHYFHITATGPWEATLTTQDDAQVWCWLDDHYKEAAKDANGQQIKDEYGRVQTVEVKVVDGVACFEGTDKFCTVRGGAGVTYLPMEYNDNQGNLRYATLRVRRLDMDYELFTNITQNK